MWVGGVYGVVKVGSGWTKLSRKRGGSKCIGSVKECIECPSDLTRRICVSLSVEEEQADKGGMAGRGSKGHSGYMWFKKAGVLGLSWKRSGGGRV